MVLQTDVFRLDLNKTQFSSVLRDFTAYRLFRETFSVSVHVL